MAKQTIGIGASANDGTGDQLRAAFDKTNDNVHEIYGRNAADDTDIAGASVVSRVVPALPHGVAGDLKGMIAYDTGFIYVCVADYVAGDATISWQRVALVAQNTATAW